MKLCEQMDQEVKQLDEEQQSDSALHEDVAHSQPAQNQYLDILTKELETIATPEAKLQHVVDFMAASLAQSGSPHFKSFWSARTLCLQLFKEPISPAVRTTLWAKYLELSAEAKRLKEILDEQSSFAAEQIEIAIQALEADVAKIESTDVAIDTNELQLSCKALLANVSYYHDTQHILTYLNGQAARINSLRKELIKTEIRIRRKNQFFQRLSKAGDKIFPRRKELIKEISDRFVNDVQTFIQAHFNPEPRQESLFMLREEIKALQAAAKMLTLNSHAFTETREHLSKCWDQIRTLDKERKKERAQQKVVTKQHVEATLKKIEDFNQGLSGLSVADGQQQLDEIVAFMRTVELHRDEVKFLREQLQQARKPLQEKAQAEELQREEQDKKRVQQKQHLLSTLKDAVAQLLQAAPDYTVDRVETERHTLVEKIQAAALTKAEKQELESALKPLQDLIADKKDQVILNLSDDDRHALTQLKELLVQKQTRRNEVKAQLELLRKARGGSGLDFEKAMSYNNQMKSEKERLDKLNQDIDEVERKIAEHSKRL